MATVRPGGLPGTWLRDYSRGCKTPYSIVHFCDKGWGMRTKAHAAGLQWFPDIFDGVPVGYWSNPEGGKWRDQPLEEDFVQITMTGCRRCPTCLRHRSNKWVDRALKEFSHSQRVWLLTLTYKDSILERWRSEGLDEEFTAGQYLTLYLKRLRNAGYAIRYLAALERGDETHRIHHHLLVHCDKSLKQRDLRGRWAKGHIHARLVDISSLQACIYAAEYVSKYLTKSKTTRIRASNRYGSTSWDIGGGQPSVKKETTTTTQPRGISEGKEAWADPHGAGLRMRGGPFGGEQEAKPVAPKSAVDGKTANGL